MSRLPLNSQVLLRRDGYREVLDLWRRYQLARRPLFGRLSEAMALRDVATLYELWVFFWLVEQIGDVVGQEPVIHTEPVLRPGLPECGEARFGWAGRLLYNHGRHGYSGLLRPDYLWVADGERRIAFDAKFRMTTPEVSDEAINEAPERQAKRADLDKMHTYRDALGLDAAVCVYPGDVSRRFGADGTQGALTVADVLGGFEGIGALAARPGSEG